MGWIQIHPVIMGMNGVLEMDLMDRGWRRDRARWRATGEGDYGTVFYILFYMRPRFLRI
jgi:hypothetical protein